ncbi:MAG: anthranilate synthase component I family protein, partial [Magnetococcales bacterium]|nr:anthranilate synthase component I family protein [Magnetococcales bacterium]
MNPSGSDPLAATAPQPLTPARLREGICLVVDFPELGTPLLFRNPARLLEARRPEQVLPVIREAEAAARAGLWVGGFLAYEAAAAFDLPVCAPPAGTDPPLAWFALFAAPPVAALYPASPSPAPFLTPPLPGISRERFEDDLAVIAERIRAGESYQVNYTLEARLPEVADPAELFLLLQQRHRFPRAMWIQGEGWCVASFSPEGFLERRGATLVTAPIKGTRPRSGEPSRDRRLARELELSEKDQAEHIMIVDMARNDLGRICCPGSVGVESLAARRSFSTVHHLETRVTGKLRPGVDLAEILAAMFPPASITGAPKRRTMEIIRALEQRPRGVYTGVMGLLTPDDTCWLNVAIRTVVQSGQEKCRIGLGGGVVADSLPKAEWNEVADK